MKSRLPFGRIRAPFYDEQYLAAGWPDLCQRRGVETGSKTAELVFCTSGRETSRVNELNRLLARIEASQMWGYFHKDWLLQIRASMRPQLPAEYSLFVESEAILVAPALPAPPSPLLPDLGIARPERKTVTTGVGGRITAALVEVEEPCETYQTYTLLIRRAPENRLVAALELLSPTNKGLHGTWDREKFLRKRAQYLESAISLMEIDALLGEEKLLPTSLAQLQSQTRTVWTAFHDDGKRLLCGWGWSDVEAPPTVAWELESGLKAVVDLAQTLREALTFNPWESLVK